MKMSYRDKVILTVLVFLITVLIGGMTVIKSSVQKLQSTTVTYKQKKQEEAAVQAKLATKQDLESQIDSAYKECKKLGEFFLPEMKSYQIDQYVSNIFTNNELEVTSVMIDEASAQDIEYYAYELFNIEYELGTAADLNKSRLHGMKGNTEYAFAAAEPEQLIVSEVTVKVKVDEFEKYLVVCDAIADDSKSIVLRQLSKAAGSGDGEGGSDQFVIFFYQLSDIQKPKY
ncbi:MAG: hypothetical protein ACI4KD_08530 [Oscillospiraceae bacterium]